MCEVGACVSCVRNERMYEGVMCEGVMCEGVMCEGVV